MDKIAYMQTNLIAVTVETIKLLETISVPYNIIDKNLIEK